VIHEVLHEVKVKKNTNIMLKLDFEKAYRVELKVLEGGNEGKKGFLIYGYILS
jgi:hypothetical protein